MNYQLIALDMDGTLLNDEKKITEETLSYIKRAKEKGVKVVISSGRVPGGLKFYEETIAKEEPMICANGALILNDKKETIYNEAINKNTLLDIIDILRKYKNTYYHFYHDNIMCTEKFDYSTKKFYEFNKNIERKYRIEIRIITDSKEYIKHRSSEITKIVVVDNDLEYLNRIQKEIEDNLKVSVTKSHISNIEICNFGISKGIALEKLADYYNIPIEKCIAVGNDENDISMIKRAGLGVFMKNTREELKKYADYVTYMDNNNDGIAEVIEKFIL
ncbi:Cof-type HAD-IIB family hydrolase [Clostridium botulinum]|uniref:Cof-type HAD-IIB family hydrolase n=1 Tax=Clostridium botulinum TaxID=1491 RepID=UPI00099C6726|nr:Cof-type HAD-IIB family hydrolase [Clostridium botulinum]MCC5418159.1 Cof-type HAD-IIB family hydrolase [Clostridium botulinum]NCI22510.1 Cof-type HAD-IIB family hydrolase [Clostridium botulinum]NCI36976.1 Cof-type HAD-IIB family hydrolase [Clostridium botulinum]NCI74652.1 Cof-type HAD-IIB family hydrolase [Clostridium botulinum]NDI40779.1 Cof-type HAD-IIB family hydrolase [Clostridium botulinum]